MRIPRAVVTTFAFALSLGGGPNVAHTQSDWGLTRPRSTPAGRSSRPRARRRPAAAESGPTRSEALIDRYLRVLARNANDTFALQRLVALFRERDGNTRQLRERLEHQEGLSPLGAATLKGHILRADGRPGEARDAYRAALGIDPQAVAVRVALAELARESGDPKEAISHYEQVLSSRLAPALERTVLRALGELALDRRDYERARGFYRRLARDAARNVFLQTEYARALSERDEHERAAAEYQHAIGRLRGDNRVVAPLWSELGRAQMNAGAVDAAIQSLERALRLSGQARGIRSDIYATMLEAYRRDGRLAELAERLGRERPSFEALELLGRVEDELGHQTEALHAYRRALRLDRRHLDTRVRIIQLLSRSGQIPEVIAEYRALVRVAPREPRFVVELARLLMQTGRRSEALTLAQQTGRRHARDPAIHQALAEFYARWGEDRLAARAVEVLAKIDPRDPTHLIALGDQQLESGDREGAIATWRRILGVDSNRARAHATLAGVLADHDLLELAVQQYEHAVEKKPDELRYVRGLAATLERQRRHEAATRQWERVLVLARDDRASAREARQRIVALWERMGTRDARVREHQSRFEAQPPDLESGRFLAEIYRRQGPASAVEAERILERVARHAPGDVETWLSLERVRVAQGDLDGAIGALERLLEADPPRAARYLQRMAEYAHARYRDEQAVSYAVRSVQRAPQDADAHRRLGDLYRARQDLHKASASYRRALDLNERLFPVYFDLAELYLSQEKTQPADALYRRVMQLSVDDDLVARAVRASLQLNLGAGTLAELERDLLPLALGHPQRPIYRRLLVELYAALFGPSKRALDSEALRAVGRRALKPLLEALADQDPSQRRIAVGILARLGDSSAATPLLAAAEGQGEVGLRMEALAAAGAVADRSLASRFVPFTQASERRLRGIAAWALARMGGTEAVSALRSLADRQEPEVRAFAVLGLGRAEETSSAELLQRLLHSDRDEVVRAAAAWALGRVGTDAVVPVLSTALEREVALVKRAATVALGAIGNTAAVPVLARGLFDVEARQRAASASALTRITGPSPRRREEALVWTAGTTARQCLQRLLDLDPPRPTIDVLTQHRAAIAAAARQALRGPVERVNAALAVLMPSDSRIGVAPLMRDAADWPPDALARSERELRELGGALLPDLTRLLAHPDARVRTQAVAVLSRIPSGTSQTAFTDALEDDEPLVRQQALEALAEVPRPERSLVDRVARTLRTDRIWAIRVRAARALRQFPVRVAYRALVEALRADRYAFVREEAARSLGVLGGPLARGRLQDAATNDTEPRVRRAAAQALGRLKAGSSAD